ncbi:putative L,D-transpeptidase ErfK/SrfK precursor [Tritonibacter multivorans]|uniref:Putative L,D-transpeptidase ErfK/SrfK n=1 Tax=Tritonibacter multivorans TaxID=928856 RepID=A0A0P1G025_9RHOB|nr:L,D-transpeptidase [Tritonibacter multivorans]MDA7422451.1 L,D-transpeptidase [Tritonibacter multivorans]CUH74918.1 putative L,D-transpeptidase ErfK/SrfK precursor [Tritonibacter multivorans]SFD43648.1 L,D-transpeptidase catalytic domain [Tritonibacter multivorans]
MTHPSLDRRRFVTLGLAAAGSLILPPMAEAKVPRSHGDRTSKIVSYTGSEAPGTLVISNRNRSLLRVLRDGKAERFRISVGRDGFTWTGVTRVGRKAEWPGWRPPSAMRKRQPSLPGYVPPGPYNPLGARAIYLFSGGRDTLYRIHGTNSADTVGGYETSGCFRLTNADVLYLYPKVRMGTKVVVY